MITGSIRDTLASPMYMGTKSKLSQKLSYNTVGWDLKDSWHARCTNYINIPSLD